MIHNMMNSEITWRHPFPPFLLKGKSVAIIGGKKFPLFYIYEIDIRAWVQAGPGQLAILFMNKKEIAGGDLNWWIKDHVHYFRPIIYPRAHILPFYRYFLKNSFFNKNKLFLFHKILCCPNGNFLHYLFLFWFLLIHVLKD